MGTGPHAGATGQRSETSGLEWRLAGESQTGGIAISCAFEENTVRAISHAAHDRGVLVRRAVRNRGVLRQLTATSTKLAPRVDTVRRAASKHRSIVTAGALPEDKPVSPMSEVARALGGAFRSPLTPWLGHTVNKSLFDERASRIDYGDADVLLGMPGSSLRTFQRNSDRTLVFHEIDAHPRVRNELLTRFFGKRKAAAELIPSAVVDRIEAEIELSDRVLVPGHVVADQMIAQGVASAKILRVAYGVDPLVFRPRESAARRDGPLRVVFTGQVTLRKGVPFLIEAVRGLNVELTIVGQAFDRRLIQDLPRNVRFVGVLSAPDLALLYADSDLFVLPTIEDCFSLVVAEAAAAGLPVVTTYENGAYELLSRQHSVLQAGDVTALREAINGAEPLTQARRAEIAEESASLVWATWPEYGDEVLRQLGVWRSENGS